jgi:hypothetical protein
MNTTTCESETEIRTLSDDQLAALYAAADNTLQSVILAEGTRRDRRDKQSAVDKARWQRSEAEWFDGAHAQFLAAEAQTSGYLLNREGLEVIADPWALWNGSERRAMKYASDELKRFWDDNPRVTKSQYAYWVNRPRRAERNSA